VSEGTPAAKAGLQVEDVIVKVNGKPVADDIEFRSLIAAAAPGDTVELLVRRGGKDVTIKAKLEPAPDLTASAEPQAPKGSGRIGIAVESLNADSARQFNLGDLREGVVVVRVEAGGAADEAGVEPGDVLVRVNGRDVKTPAEFDKVISDAKSGDRLSVVVRREKARSLVTIEVP